MNRSFYVKAYRALSGAYYGASGQSVSIDCNHTVVGDYGINPAGQIVSVPASGIVTAGAKSVLIPPATQFPNTTQRGLSLTAVKLIKDNVAQTSYYVDSADYAANVVKCNPVAYATSCPAVTAMSAGTPGATSATITWTEDPGIAGVEWVNNTSSSAPAGDGTFLVVGTHTVAVTGLTTATTYRFWIRTICAGGVRSAWQSLTYTTA